MSNDETLITFDLPLGTGRLEIYYVVPECAIEFCRRVLAGESARLGSMYADVEPVDVEYHNGLPRVVYSEYQLELLTDHGECHMEITTPQSSAVVPLVVDRAVWEKKLLDLSSEWL